MASADYNNPPNQQVRQMNETEYLAFEAWSDIRHEYTRGRVEAMTGASVRHNIITGNLQTMLNTQLADQPCIVTSSDLRVRVASDAVSYRYPDVMVICGAVELWEERDDTVLNPTVLIEVLSPSTALKDHNEKLGEYLSIESVQAYLLVSQHEAKIEVYSRQTDDSWRYQPLSGLGTEVEILSINCTLSLAQVYAKVDFDTE